MSQSLLGQHSCCANVFSAGVSGGARGAGRERAGAPPLSPKLGARARSRGTSPQGPHSTLIYFRLSYTDWNLKTFISDHWHDGT